MSPYFMMYQGQKLTVFRGKWSTFYPGGMLQYDATNGNIFYPNGRLAFDGQTEDEYYEDGCLKRYAFLGQAYSPTGDLLMG